MITSLRLIGELRRGSLPALFAAATLFLGCTTFAPAYDAGLDQRVSAGALGAEQLLAAVEIGEYGKPASFADARSRYIDIMATLAIAEARAKALPVGSKGTATQARDALVSLIAGCREQVLSLAMLHKRRGLSPDLPVASSVRTSCELAADAAQTMR